MAAAQTKRHEEDKRTGVQEKKRKHRKEKRKVLSKVLKQASATSYSRRLHSNKSSRLCYNAKPGTLPQHLPSSSCSRRQRHQVSLLPLSSPDPEDPPFRPQIVGVVKVLNDFFSGDGNLSSSECVCSMYDPQPMSDRPVGLRFPHRAGRFRPEGSPFISPGCRSCACMERFMIWGWDPVVPGRR